jgi:hypothetical protein
VTVFTLKLKKLMRKLYMWKNNLLKIAAILCLLMTVPCLAHSQDTSRITITSDQLRTANLIFAEHKEYSNLVPLLRQENSNLTLINKSWEHTDSIKTSQLREQEQKMMKQALEVERLKKNLKVSSAVGGSVAGVVILAAVLSLCLK